MKIPSLFLSAAGAVSALTIAEINGNKFLSPYKDQSVTNVTGLVLAKGPSGIWIRSTEPDDDDATSEAVYVYGSSVGTNLTVGDIVTLDGKVAEYRYVACLCARPPKCSQLTTLTGLPPTTST